MRLLVAVLVCCGGCDSVLDLDRFVFDASAEDIGRDVPAPDVAVDPGPVDVGTDAMDASDSSVDTPSTCDPGGVSTWVQVGDDFACADNAPDRSVYCWGRGSGLGRASTASVELPEEILSAPDPASTLSRLPAMWTFVIGARNGFAFPSEDFASEGLRAWGGGGNGVLNEGMDVERPPDRRSSFELVNPIRSSIPPAVGIVHACHVAVETGLLRCWGTNTGARLGRASNPGVIVGAALTFPPNPPFDEDETWSQIGSRRVHTCGLTSDGELYAFGGSSLNAMLALGRPAGDPSDVGFMTTPTRFADVAGPPSPDVATQVSCGRDFSCYVTTANELYCLGASGGRRLGGPADEPSRASRGEPILGRTDWVGVSAGDDSACAWTNEELFCWGDNRGGEVGVPPAMNNLGPTLVGGLDEVRMADAGNNSSCAVDGCGFVYCWGSDEFGQLGQGEGDQSSPIPLRVTIP